MFFFFSLCVLPQSFPKLFLLPGALLFSFCSGRKYRPAYGLNRCKRHLRQSLSDKLDDTTANWFKIDQISNKLDGTTWYQRDVSAYHSPLFSSRTPHQHAKPRHSERKPASVTLPTQIAAGNYLDHHEIIALHLAVMLSKVEFHPSCTQIRVGGSQTGTPNQSVSFTLTTTEVSTLRARTHPERHTFSLRFRWWTRVEARLARGYDWLAVRERLVVISRGNSSPSPAAKNGKPTSTNGAGSGPGAQPKGMALSPLNRVRKHQKRDAGIVQHKRHMSFMRAIRDIFYHHMLLTCLIYYSIE